MSAEEHSNKVGAAYDQRASNYDKSFHVQLANDFIKWAELKPESSLLDLAAGTGLISIPAKKEIGDKGHVIGVDVSEGMQAVAKQKSEAEGLQIKWLLGNIGDMERGSFLREEIMKSVPTRGFDTITCCAALILVTNPAEAISYWADMLAPGGQMLIDIPHPNCQFIPRIMHQLADEGYFASWLMQGLTHGVPSESDLRRWFEHAGLTVDTWSTRSYEQKEMDLSQPDMLWQATSRSPTWNLQIKTGIDEEVVKNRFIQLLSEVQPGSQIITEHAQLIVAHGRKRGQ